MDLIKNSHVCQYNVYGHHGTSSASRASLLGEMDRWAIKVPLSVFKMQFSHESCVVDTLYVKNVVRLVIMYK
ncbi:hypothetical protein YC2023_046671 [Brassica napus]